MQPLLPEMLEQSGNCSFGLVGCFSDDFPESSENNYWELKIKGILLESVLVIIIECTIIYKK